MVSMGNERDVDVAFIGDSKLDDAVVVQIDTGDRTKRLRVMLNEAILFDADPELNTGSITAAEEQWGVMDVGVLHAPGFHLRPSQEEAHKSSRNMGDDEDPIFYATPVKRLVRKVGDVEYASAWRIYPTEEQLRLKPGWRKSVGEEPK